MPTRQAFAFLGFVVDRCSAACAALLWLLPIGLVAFSGALGGLQGFFGSALLQWGGAHVCSRKAKARTVAGWVLGLMAHGCFDKDLRLRSADGVSVGAQASHAGGSAINQRE